MATPGVVILEKRSWWEAALKRALADDPIQVRPCRLPIEVCGLLESMPGSVLVLPMELGAAECLRLIAKAIELPQPTAVVVLAPAALAELEWAARELGVVEFLPDTISGLRLGDLCRRLVARGVPLDLADH